LLSVYQKLDAHVAGIPRGLINFVAFTACEHQWETLLPIDDDIKDGKRPKHATAIQSKRDLHAWIERRVNIMFENMDGKKNYSNVEEGA
jgi:hypothetical protein